jgi:hypothetical protein
MKPRSDEETVKKCRDFIEKWKTYFKFNIDEYHNMHRFVMAAQWNEEETDILKSFKKVPLTFNKLSTLINTLLGEQQQNTPQIEIVPLSNCTQETAKLRQIVVKDIMLSSDAKTVYQVAASQAFIGGFGAFIIDTDYTHDKSFDQDIVYRSIKDATRCYWDIGAEHINKIDGMRCGYITRMTRDKFKQLYGVDVENTVLADDSKKAVPTNSEIAAAVETTIQGDLGFGWADDHSVTIIDDYERTFKKDTLYKLSNGETLNQEEMDELIESSREHIEKMKEARMMMEQAQQSIQAMGGGDYGMQPQTIQPQQMQGNMGMMQEGPQGMEPQPMPEMDMEAEEEAEEDIIPLYMNGELVRIEDERPSKKSVFIHKKMAGHYILEEEEFPAEDCPVIFVDQNSTYDKEGKQICRSFITDAVDAQRFLNYLGTQIAYLLKISRYDQFIGSKENARSPQTQKIWTNPAAVQGLLMYDESPNGNKPEQLRPPELPISLVNQYERAVEDMYTSTGMYPSRLGQQGNEVSGAAIDARTRQGSYPTYVAFNSINRAITAGGRIVNQMIPRVYDTQRVLSLMMPDEGQKNITVNEQQDEYGENIKNDIRKGSFEVRLQAGPSYEGQKAEALQSLNLALQGNPQIFNLVADLYAENLPLTNTLEIRNRFKTLVPPEIIEAGKSGKMPQQAQTPNPQDQAAMAEAEYKKHKIELEKQKVQMEMQEIQSKAELEQKEMQLKYLQAASSLEEAKLRYMAETDRTHSDNAISHADNITKIMIAKQRENKNGSQSERR